MFHKVLNLQNVNFSNFVPLTSTFIFSVKWLLAEQILTLSQSNTQVTKSINNRSDLKADTEMLD